MSASRIRTALKHALKPLGFSALGSSLVLRQPELEHVIAVVADRRLKGRIDIFHSIFDAAEPESADRRPLLEETLQGFRKPYFGSWLVESFDASLAVKQAEAITATFSSLTDVAHFYSDRPSVHGNAAPPQLYASASPRRALSKAQLDLSLQRLALAIFSKEFMPAQRLAPDIWAHNLDVGGYRYCAQLVANNTATLGSLHYFPFATIDVAKGQKNTEVLSLLYRVPKRVLFDGEKPILLSLTDDEDECAQVSSVLLGKFEEVPPNALPWK